MLRFCTDVAHSASEVYATCMYLIGMDAPSFPEQRTYVVAHLTRYRALFQQRALARITPEQRRMLGLRLLVDEMNDRLIASVERGSWDDLCDWLDARSFTINEHVAQQVLLIVIDTFNHELEAGLPAYAALLGEVRLNLQRLLTIIRASDRISWREREARMHDPVDVAVDHVISSLEEKDSSTGEHSRAVSAWCTRLARKLGLSEAMLIKVKRGGLVHDLGKTTTPLEVLTAPRRLTEDEWRIMQNHVIAGYEMIGAVPALGSFSSIVRNHHERYLGGGYPDGLIRDEIPLATRIVTVADCFNAMIGRRPYRVPLTPSAAIEELRRHRKTQFDPDVTDAMTEIVYEMTQRGGAAIPDDWHWQRPEIVES